MEIGRIAGQVVSTVRAKDLPYNALLMVDLLDRQGEPTGKMEVALDVIGAGEGEWVILVRGSSARNICGQDSPVDLAVVGIVDQVSSRGQTLYSKTAKE